MSLTRKHYEQFAHRIANAQADIDRQKDQGVIQTALEAGFARNTLHQLAIGLSVDFALDNPRFDRQRFLKACGF
jgi:hypothetical protein